MPKVAYNANGAPASISAASPFILYSAYLTAAFNDNLQLEAQGYIGSTLAYDNTYSLMATGPTLISFNYLGVTSVQFISSGGTPHRGYAGAGTEFVMDNLDVFVQPLPPAPPPALPLNVVYNFDGFDGAASVSGLIQASNGNFYGTTEYGGADGAGTVFCLTTNGVLTTLLSLTSFNANPQSALLQAADGNLYGTSSVGGTHNVGTIFRVTTNGALTTLASFNQPVTGAKPVTALLQGPDGNFYGTAPSGGAYDLGTIFKMTPAGALSPLISFADTNGSYPSSPLVLGPNGDFYGTTSSGGANESGTLFSVDTNGNFATLFTFGGIGSYPNGGLLLGRDGNLYGTTEEGGTNDSGTVFCWSTNGTVSTVASFDYDTMGGFPTTALIQGTDGNFYGTTSQGGTFGTYYYGGTFGSGTVFKLTTNGTMSEVVAFQNTNGLSPQASLLQAADGSFYGTTTYGGVGYSGFFESGDGVIFRLGPPAETPPAVITQPVSLNVPAGGIATFSISASGASPLNYSWQSNGITIPGANQSFYAQTNVQLSESGAQFTCLVGNAFGTVLSSNATLTVAGAGSLYSFLGPEGAWPYSRPLQGADGAFYGTTEYGGANGDGTVFRLTTNGSYSILFSFDFYVSGANPLSSLVQGSDGSFYGTATFGGPQAVGTVFRVTTNGTLRILASFGGLNGSEPFTGIIQAFDGSFYGLTRYGGTYNAGTVFRLTTNGTLTTLASFDGANGSQPYGGLRQGIDGNLYGTTYYGGADSEGTVFQVTTNGILTTLVSFQSTNGAYPEAGLVQGPGGLFYGSTSQGGTYGDGTLFSITTNGTLTTLFSFSGLSGNAPSAPLLLASDGNFYGTTTEGGTYSNGTVFCLLTNGFVTNLLQFQGSTNGASPGADLVEGNDGYLYGTTTSGGIGYNGLSWSGNGTVFRLPAALPSSPPRIISQPSSVTVLVGGTATFNVNALGTPPLSYSWQCNGTNINGATLAGFFTNDVQLSESGNIFTCLISNAYGVTTSSNAILTVLPVTPPPPPPPTNPPLFSFLSMLYSFAGFDGGHPTAALVQGNDGNFYGTTGYGGTYNHGSIFKMTTNGSLFSLFSFNGSDGAYPSGGLTQGVDGNFYGMTKAGGDLGFGNIFLLQTNGALATLYSFNDGDGAYPTGSLVQGPDGNLYGTTSAGGTYGYGTVFAIYPFGTLAFSLSFDDKTNGANPYGSLVLGNDGVLYGTTQYGGANGEGTVFSLTQTGVLQTLASFNFAVTGAYPTAPLMQGRDGELYGTTAAGGTNGGGVIFSVTPGGLLTPLFSFANSNGSEPFGGLAQTADGYLYGTTEYGGSNNLGTIFRCATNGTLTNLFSFGGTNGMSPQAGLIQGTDGFLYGTATLGGEGFSGANSSGDGTVFRLSASLSNAPPAIIAQPAPQFATSGGSAVFNIVASGIPPLSYSWERNGSTIAGANQPSYALNKLRLTDSGSQFTCVVQNAYGTVTSSSAALTVFAGSGPLFSFNGPDGGSPAGGLIHGNDGNFYGTTSYGGVYGAGSLFEVTSNGLFGTLFSFNVTNGAQPVAALLLGADGSFYGTTEAGGAFLYGTVFRFTPGGALTTLTSFDGANGAYPWPHWSREATASSTARPRKAGRTMMAPSSA